VIVIKVLQENCDIVGQHAFKTLEGSLAVTSAGVKNSFRVINTNDNLHVVSEQHEIVRPRTLLILQAMFGRLMLIIIDHRGCLCCLGI
jgi:hypothetical protein